jgi:hypothetical protein
MRYATIRIAAVLGASMALGGCVGYGFPGDYGYGNGNPYGYGDQQPYPGSYGGRTFRCESQDNRMQRCSADTRYGVSISRRLSDAPCIQGRTWGYDRNGVWVNNGCRAEFTIGGGNGGPSYPGGGYGQGRTVRCESQENRQRRCNVSVYQGVQLQRKLSDSSCNQGTDWGWDRQGIWVNNGCRADFLVY